MELPIDKLDVKSLIPHREPFLFVDALKEYYPGERLVAVKAVSRNEPWCQGHFPDFPDFPVMPGVLNTEALAQTCGAFMEQKQNEQTTDKEQIYILLRSDVRFPKPVHLGTVIELDVSIADVTSAYVEFKVKAIHAGKTCVRGSLYVASSDKNKLVG
jgi:3-hydroxyacyl-[acyl-carrier-protein] dehydratase